MKGGKEKTYLWAGHRTGLSLSSEDFRLDQWFSISSSKEPCSFREAPQGPLSDRNQEADWVGGFRISLVLENSTAFMESSHNISRVKSISQLSKWFPRTSCARSS